MNGKLKIKCYGRQWIFLKYYVDEFARVIERLTQFEEQETPIASTARDSAHFENIHFTYVPPEHDNLSTIYH